ncbi:MAG: N-acetyltransferase [Dehalococcoidales bacterium]|nr:N-acetyltransferase [Dehalococcoidales bacterium]
MEIRRETPADFPDIYDLVEIAFQTARVSNGKEPDVIDQLRRSGNYVPELALVAEEDGKLIGHIMLTKTFITSGGNKVETLLLAPVSVAFAYRNKGVGTKLMTESFEIAKTMGYKSVIFIGPAYFYRFGFKPTASFGIRNVRNIPEDNVMACELVPNGLEGINGTIDC